MTPPVTPKQSLADILNEIESRANAATKGPWETYEEPSIDYRPCQIYQARRVAHVAWLMGGGPKLAISKPEERANAAFIASARTDLPKLVKALRKALVELQTVLHPTWVDGFKADLAAILTSPENGEQQSLGEPRAV